MAKDEQTSSADEQWEISIKFANLGERNDFLEAADRWTKTGSSGPILPFAALYIKRWPYAGLDPARIADYRMLSTEQWDEEVVPRLTRALEAFRG